MSKSDQKKFVKSLRDQGFEVTLAGNGHLRVTNPQTMKSAQIAYSPSDSRGILNAKMRLKRKIGFDPRA